MLTALCLFDLFGNVLGSSAGKRNEGSMKRLVTIVILLMGWAGLAQAEIQQFQSPSGNIRCLVSVTDVAGVRCDLEVDRQSYTDRPASCEGDWGTSFVVLRAGEGLLNCARDAIDDASASIILPYGGSLDLGGITCLSETTGMTCTNAEGGGFSVRRAEQRIF